MPLITPDFSEVTDNNIPEGTFPAYIKSGEAQTSKNGNPMVKWELELFGTPAVKGRVVITRTPTTGKGAFRLQEIYKAATGEDLKKGQQFDTDQLIMNRVMVTLVKTKDDQGNLRNFPDVKAIAPYREA